MGSSISSRSSWSRFAEEWPCFFSISTWDEEIEYNTASRIEQNAETATARTTAIISVLNKAFSNGILSMIFAYYTKILVLCQTDANGYTRIKI